MSSTLQKSEPKNVRNFCKAATDRITASYYKSYKTYAEMKVVTKMASIHGGVESEKLNKNKETMTTQSMLYDVALQMQHFIESNQLTLNTMEKVIVEVKVEGELLFVFRDFQHWVNKAQSRIGGFPMDEKIVCVDKNGHALTVGKDFRIAEENGLFPVSAYRLIRTSEATN
jgi:hypothetical protein